MGIESISEQPPGYRGRIAPTPTGYLHLGHARTFWLAAQRAIERQGTLVLRNEDLDPDRCRPVFAEAMIEDLQWFGLRWDEGPDVGGPHGPYQQSQRRSHYLEAWRRLASAGAIYPSPHSRRDVEQALLAPHETERERIFPIEFRPAPSAIHDSTDPGQVNWRFRVPDGEEIPFVDLRLGRVAFRAGVDFGDFLVWRKDGFPAYELAVVVDDAKMRISEVVRGEDLLLSTARQLLIYRALHWSPPAFYHAPLMLDDSGRRLAKRHQSLAIRELRSRGHLPDELQAGWRSLLTQ